MKAGNYRVAWKHQVPKYIKGKKMDDRNKLSKKNLPKGATKVDEYTYVVPGTTICYIMEYVKGDKSDPVVCEGKATQFVGRPEKYMNVTQLFTTQGIRVPGEVFTKLPAVKGDRFVKEEGRILSLKRALKVGLESGKLKGTEVNEIFTAYKNRKNDNKESK